MPTYEYVCRKCGHEFELFQQMSAPVKRKCPECGALKLERLIGTGAGVIFKGGGFYETDYRSESYKKAAEAEKKAAEGKSEGGDKSEQKKKDTASTSDASSTSKKESKPAAKGKGGGSDSSSGGSGKAAS